MIAVVGFGDDRKSDALGCADGVRLALYQFLLGHGKSEAGQYFVGLFLVARQLDRDVRGAAGHRCLDALLKLAMAQLHQRLIIEPKPRNAAMLGRANQRGRRGPQGPPLRESNELIARFLPLPVIGDRTLRADRGRQQRTQQLESQIAGCDAFITLRILIDHGIDARRAGAARFAEGDLLAGNILQLDGDVFEDMS